jgi:hypothetical protein
MHVTRERTFWYRFFADLGWMIFPGGFDGPSTTEWLRFTYKAGEPVAWLCTSAYEVRCQGTFAWFEEEDLLTSLPRLRTAYLHIKKKLRAANIHPSISPLKDDDYEIHQYLQQISAPALRTELQKIVLFLEAILTEMDIYERGGKRPLYVLDYLKYGFCWLTITPKTPESGEAWT